MHRNADVLVGSWIDADEDVGVPIISKITQISA